MTDTRNRILAVLISHCGEFVSGGKLANDLGVSRVSIKHHMDHFASLGFQIEAVRNRGYCLLAMPHRFQTDAFLHHFGESLPIGQCCLFDSVDSTNMELDRRLNRGEPAPLLAIAGSQTHGKGRRGNTWHSEDGANLYLSLGFRPHLTVSRMGIYTLWIGLCLARMLRERAGVKVMVKWPNDLYLEGRKLGGILTEAKVDTDHVQHLIVGLGLNVNATRFTGELEHKAISLRMATGRMEAYNSIAAEIACTVLNASKAYFETPKELEIQKMWGEYDFLAHRSVQARAANRVVSGVAAGIDERGELRIRLDGNAFHTVHSGEVTMTFENE